MAGAFTHISICDKICSDARKDGSLINEDLGMLLNSCSQFVYLGAVSPDLPYLSFSTGSVNWADVFHYEYTNSVVINGFNDLKSRWSGSDESAKVQLAWLLGYVSHLIVDATVHPVVQATVGDYEQNKEEHRTCEMTQDSLVFKKVKNSEIQYAEFIELLEFCCKSEYYESFLKFWKDNIEVSYKNKLSKKEHAPEPGSWITTYLIAVHAAADGGRVKLFRHAGIIGRLLYKTTDDIIRNHADDYDRYYTSVALPVPAGAHGNFYDEGVDYAVKNVSDAWNKIYSALTSGTNINVSSVVRNWNLDTGVDLDSAKGEVTFWK